MFLCDEYYTQFAHAIAAVLELGALLGALGAGVFADRYSRGTSIVVACGENAFFFGLRISAQPEAQSCFVLALPFNALPLHSPIWSSDVRLVELVLARSGMPLSQWYYIYSH
jgi:MFS family permease